MYIKPIKAMQIICKQLHVENEEVAATTDALKTLNDIVALATPTRPVFFKEEWGVDSYCPNDYCGDPLDEEHNYCPRCGQAINWEPIEQQYIERCDELDY